MAICVGMAEADLCIVPANRERENYSALVELMINTCFSASRSAKGSIGKYPFVSCRLD
jgi:hypothetical protein